jgi:hypothetical protein
VTDVKGTRGELLEHDKAELTSEGISDTD